MYSHILVYKRVKLTYLSHWAYNESLQKGTSTPKVFIVGPNIKSYSEGLCENINFVKNND